MDRESVERLRFDRRLQRRRELVDDAERQAYLESLPDVSEKMTRGPVEPQPVEKDALKSASPPGTGFDTAAPSPDAPDAQPAFSPSAAAPASDFSTDPTDGF